MSVTRHVLRSSHGSLNSCTWLSVADRPSLLCEVRDHYPTGRALHDITEDAHGSPPHRHSVRLFSHRLFHTPSSSWARLRGRCDGSCGRKLPSGSARAAAGPAPRQAQRPGGAGAARGCSHGRTSRAGSVRMAESPHLYRSSLPMHVSASEHTRQLHSEADEGA